MLWFTNLKNSGRQLPDMRIKRVSIKEAKILSHNISDLTLTLTLHNVQLLNRFNKDELGHYSISIIKFARVKNLLIYFNVSLI